jgi:hypothetical protein
VSRGFSLPACLVLLCTVIALGATTAEAAGIGVHLRVHAQNIPGAVAGRHSPHAGMGAGAQTPSQLNPNTRSIQPGGAGESTATRSPNERLTWKLHVRRQRLKVGGKLNETPATPGHESPARS